MAAAHLGRTEAQASLFPDAGHERMRSVDQAVDAIRRRFGSGSIRREGG
jgi:hypothetical protein